MALVSALQENRKHARVSAHFLFRLYRACLTIGARQPVLLAALDLKEADLRDPVAQFDSDTVPILCQTSCRELGGRDATMEIGRLLVPTGFSDKGYTAIFERNFGDALAASLAALEAGAGETLCCFKRTKDSHRLIWNRKAGYADEYVRIVFSNLIAFGESMAAGQFPTVKAACFAHEKPDGCGDHIHGEGIRAPIPCHFGQPASYLEYHPQLMGLPNPLSNRSILTFDLHEEYAGTGTPEILSLPRLMYRYLLPLLDKNGLSLDCAAETFGIAERSLRRKLVMENTSFRQILEQVRRDACRLYFLEGRRSLSEIATKLGYSELSAFTRAYSAWHGHPPSRDMGAVSAFAA